MSEMEKRIQSQIENNQQLCSDVEFMKKAVAINERFIAYDKTENEEVYLIYIEHKKMKLKENRDRNQRLIDCLTNVENEIFNPKAVEEDKYKIPHKYIFERIKRAEEEGENLAPFDLNQYFMLDGKYSKEFGREMEELYDDPNYYLGIHGTSSITKKEEIDKVLSEGLRATTQGRGPGHLASHVYYGENIYFLQALSFIRNNPNLAETIFLLRIPKKVFEAENPEPLYGSDEMTLNHEAHILPQYMYGYTQRKAASEYENGEQQMFERTIVKNNTKQRRYKYGFHEITVDSNRTPIIINGHKSNRDEQEY